MFCSGAIRWCPAEVKGLAYGLYGKTPAPMDKKVQKIILKGYERGEEPTTKRPGEILEPEWDKAVAETKGLAKNDGDVLIYALYPTTGSRFLKWKYGLEPIPDEVKPKTLEQVKLEDEVYTTIKGKKLFAKVKEYLDTPGKGGPGQGRRPPHLQRLRGRGLLRGGGGVHLRGSGDHRPWRPRVAQASSLWLRLLNPRPPRPRRPPPSRRPRPSPRPRPRPNWRPARCPSAPPCRA